MSTHNQGRRPLFGPVSQTAYMLDWFRKLRPSALVAPIDDAQGTARDLRRGLDVGPGFYRGRVVDVIAYAQCYRVLLERNGGVRLCMAMTAGGVLPVGPCAINAIGPGAEVYVLLPATGGYGVILGGIPSAMTDPSLVLPDFVHQASRCGLRVDKTHSAAFACSDNGGIADWSSGRPYDGMSLGEWGAIAETGLRVFLDPFMAQLAVDEGTGVFAFYHDQLLRLAGYNTQAFSGGHESEVGVDQFEVHHYDGFTPYPWEQSGALIPGRDPYRDVVPQDVQFDQAHYAAWEPQQDDQMPFHRSLQFRGYLGQGGKRMVQAPPEDGDINTYSGDADYAALFEENLGLDGRYSLRSAKAIHIVKWAAISPVKRARRIEDAAGDNETNYQFAGYIGEGQAHKVAGAIEADDANPHLQQAAGVLDVHAWVFNWLGAHPFYYHQNDWTIPDESATFAGRVTAPISFGDLAGSFYLPRPDAVSRQVDHRYGGVDYFPNHSYIGMHDDGGVVIGDGYGAEIRMCGGHIFVTAPGDVWAKPGRNFNVLAGHDACLRAYNSLDLSATNKDLRLKAERNLHLLGGNSGQAGGVLVECKAPSRYAYADVVGEDVTMGGFQVKVAQGDVTLWASNIYLRTGGGDVTPGVITLDAAAGRQAITLQASTIVNFVSESILDNFGSDGNIAAAHVWGPNGNIIASPCYVQGSCTFQASILVSGGVSAVGGYFGSDQAQANEGKVGQITGNGLILAAQALAKDQGDAASAASDAGVFWQQLFGEYLYAAAQAGNDDTIAAVHFTFRNPAQYRTGDFQLYEDRWQQLARLGGQGLTAWKENPVTGATAEDTMPYPGLAPWDQDETYNQMDLALYDIAQGFSQPRKDAQAAYEGPKFAAPQPQAPSKGYLIIT
jgi:hypothetical protein